MATNIRGRNYLKLLDYTPKEIRYLTGIWQRNFQKV